MKKILGLWALLWASYTMAGDQFPRTGIIPDDPLSNTDISIGIASALSPCIGTGDMYPTFYHLSDSNHITFVIAAQVVNPCPNVPGFSISYGIGTLEEGSYTMQVYIVNSPNDVPTTINDPLGAMWGAEVSFGVGGIGSAIAIPTIGVIGLIILVSIFLVMVCFQSRRKTIFFSILFICLSLNVSAKQFALLISNEQGSPTPEEVVTQSSTSPPPASYPLQAFNDYSPVSVAYLLPDRPFGQRLELITQFPDWTLSKVYRYVVVTYDDGTSTDDLLASFDNDIYVVTASDLNNQVGTTSASAATGTQSNLQGGFIGDFFSDLDISLAWELSEGMGYIGVIDSGIDVDHNAFRAFSDTDQYLGGNLLDGYYQIDLASGDLNVDEQEPLDTGGIPASQACVNEYGMGNNLAISIFAGHGTHVAGIIGAKDKNISGICKNCGLGIMKWLKHGNCLAQFDPPTLSTVADTSVIPRYLEILSMGGYGTVNWSGGLLETIQVGNETFIVNDEFYCNDVDNAPQCDMLDLFKENNVLMVSAAGNNRTQLQFPASETKTVAVGGVDDVGNFWNESPGPAGVFDFTDNIDCPYGGDFNECGSNTSNPPIDQKVDISTQAKTVYSTFYPGGRWNDFLGCSDSSDGTPDDGYGLCTGTSMSSPQVAAIIQLMRSTNPLLPNGTYDPSLSTGLINVLNSTSSRSLSAQPVNDYLGYGIPSASLALEKILGYSNGDLMKTRLTPMFEIYSDEAKNNVYSPFPQLSFAFLAANGSDYDSNNSAPLVQEFSQYWHGPNVVLPEPRASFYVFTTNNNPFINLKNMVPLRRMEKTISGNNRNDTYAVSTTEIETFKADGYNYAGIEGYIFPTCTLLPGCIPGNAQILYRVVDDVNFNHTLVNLPVATPAPANSTILGYVFPNVDTDGDGLIDGQERILGTSITLQDTDGDGLLDGVEYPAAGVPFSDPRISDIIFADGFE